MSTDEIDEGTPDTLQAEGGAKGEEAKEKLNLEVEIQSPSACERHLTVTISRDDINRYIDNAYSEMMPTADVPGFRPGRAPRKLVEHRFRKEIAEQVKGSLLMDSLTQVSEDEQMTAIGEPEFDIEAIAIPDDGPMTFEFDVEVRPEFDLPDWKGLSIERPVKETSDAEVDRRLESILSPHGRLAPIEGAAEEGDYVNTHVTCKHGSETVASKREALLRIRPVLSFYDGNLEGFDKLMIGASAGETRTGELQLTADAPNEKLRGETVSVNFEVLEVKRLELPEMNEKLLEEMGGIESEEELRRIIRENLERQVEYRQQQEARRQILAALVESADWDLPPGLLHRQSARELERAVLELRRSGFSEEEISARRNQLRQQSSATTARALKEHFILERIAEEEEIEAEDQDYDDEVALIAAQSGESPRRVRAQLEKRGLMDTLRNQIIERRVIDRVLEEADFNDVPLEEDDSQPQTSSIEMAAGGGDDTGIPDASAASDADEEESVETAQGGEA